MIRYSLERDESGGYICEDKDGEYVRHADAMKAQKVSAEWQSIESAPKDGTYVLLYVPSRRQAICMGRYTRTQHISDGRDL